MGLDYLIALAIVTAFFYHLPGAVAEAWSEMKGRKPRTRRTRKGFKGFLGDVWEDAWEDARRRRRARRESRDPTQESAMRRWLSMKWDAAWESVEARHLARRRTAPVVPSRDTTPARPGPSAEPASDGPVRISNDCHWCGKPTTTRIGNTGVWGHVDPITQLPACGDHDIPEGLSRHCRNNCGGWQNPVPGSVLDAGDGHRQALAECGTCGARDRVWWWQADPSGDHGWIPIMSTDGDPDTDPYPTEGEPFEFDNDGGGVVHGNDDMYTSPEPRRALCLRCDDATRWTDISPTFAICSCGDVLTFEVGEVWFPTAGGQRLVLGVGDNPMGCECGSRGPWLGLDTTGTDAMTATCPNCGRRLCFPYASPGGPGGTPDAAPDGPSGGSSRSPQAPEHEWYDNQPYDDLTGVPEGLDERCRCGGTLRPVSGTQHFDADGSAMVDLKCDRNCGIESAGYWAWTDRPPAENDDAEAAEDRRGAEDGPSDAAGAGLYAERDGVPLDVQLLERVSATAGTSYEYQEVPTMAEVTGLATAIRYADGMSKSHGQAVIDAETFAAGLEANGVSGEAVAKAGQLMELEQTVATAWAELAAELGKQTAVQEAYLATPGAGHREFVTSE